MIDGTSPFALERQAMNKVPGETVADPKAEDLMESFYDDIVNDASGIGQDPRVLKQVLHDDYNSRPSQTPGPYQQGFQQVCPQLFFIAYQLSRIVPFRCKISTISRPLEPKNRISNHKMLQKQECDGKRGFYYEAIWCKF